MAVCGEDLANHCHALLGQFQAAANKEILKGFAFHVFSINEIEIKLQLNGAAPAQRRISLQDVILSLCYRCAYFLQLCWIDSRIID